MTPSGSLRCRAQSGYCHQLLYHTHGHLRELAPCFIGCSLCIELTPVFSLRENKDTMPLQHVDESMKSDPAAEQAQSEAEFYNLKNMFQKF